MKMTEKERQAVHVLSASTPWTGDPGLRGRATAILEQGGHRVTTRARPARLGDGGPSSMVFINGAQVA